VIKDKSCKTLIIKFINILFNVYSKNLITLIF